jgi:phosphoserine phosphatase
MSGEFSEQAPRWLPRSDARQAFVATLCSAGNINDALAVLYTALGDLPILGREDHGPNACAITIECVPAEAWALLKTLRQRLTATDVYLQPQDTRSVRLLICDMDMTIVAAETLDEVATRLGLGERIGAITTRAMRGEIDFDSALRERIEMLAGQPVQVFHEVASQLQLNPGASEMLAAAKAAGVHCVLISGGFAQVVEPVAMRLGFDEFYCNHLEVSQGRLTGGVLEPVVNADYKCGVLQSVARSRGHGLAACCAIGDGANDLPMLRAAGLGIAYYAKPILHAASACHIDFTDLRSAIHFMRLNNSDYKG